MFTADPLQSRLIPRQTGSRGDDPIFALDAEATRRLRAGEDVLNSTLGTLLEDDGSLATIPAILEAYRRIPSTQAAAYAPIAGPQRFLDAVSADLFGASPLASQAAIVATPGGTGALALAVANFLEPGQSLLTSSYHWSPYENIASQAGLRLETFGTFTPGGRFDARALGEALERSGAEQGRSLVFLNTPCHNPTGYSLDDDDWDALDAALLAAAARQRLTVLFDVAYARYAASTEEAEAWVQRLEPLLTRAAGRGGALTVLVAWSASKAFAQYGARVGACVALEPDARERESIRAALLSSCRGTWSNCNHLGMLAVAECLSDPELRARAERERARLRALLEARARTFLALAGSARLAHPRYSGGFFVAVFTPDAARTAQVMRAQGVFVVPLVGAVRVALCATPERSIPRLVEALELGVRAAGG